MRLDAALTEAARRRPDGAAIVDQGGTSTYGALVARADALAERFADGSGRRVALPLPASAAWIAAACALDRVGASTFLVGSELPQDALDRIVDDLALDGIVERDGRLRTIRRPGGPEPAAGPGDGAVTFLTSGTAGRPKAVRHTWDSLSLPVRVDPRFTGTRWLLAYPIHLYAGLQVFLQCLSNAGALVVLPRALDAPEVSRLLADAGVQYASATPSFWRRLLAFGSRADLARAPLTQITLGGEPVAGDVLTALGGVFPAARLVHIYATSELGRCFSVTDGRAGFPARFLDASPEPGVELRVVDGELQVRSRNRMVGYDPLSGHRADMEGWFATGDVVEVAGDRVTFRGRRTDMINVGGNKVYPFEVEAAIRTVAGVAAARAYAVPSSLMGEVVAADVVPAAGVAPDDLRARLGRELPTLLQPFQRPRRLTLLDDLDLTHAGKLSRARTDS